jgi:enoyl-CoA hydratase/carnithine racemase
MENSILLRQDDGAVRTLTLNNPARLNALSEAMLAALQRELDALASDESVRVVILRAEKPSARGTICAR